MMPGMKRFLRWAGIVVAVFSAVLLLTWVIFRESGRRQVEAEIAKIRAAGEPVTWEELDRWYVEPPPGQNAASIYTQAFAKVVEQKGVTNLPVAGLADLPELDASLPAEMKAAIADCLQTNAAALALLHQAANFRECRYPVDLTQGFSASLQPLTKLRGVARILMLEAVMSAEEEQADRAQRALLDGLALGSSLRQEPIIISRLVAIAIQGHMVTGLEQDLNRGSFTEEQLAKLMAALADAERDPGMARALIGERAFGGGFFEKVRTGKLTASELFPFDRPRGAAGLAWLYHFSGLAAREEIHYFKMLGDYIAAAKRAPSERMAAAQVTTQYIEETLPRYYILCRLLLPALGTAITKDVENFARLEVARAALAAQRYRLANGKLPAALEELVPAFLDAGPVDPFDGQPLRFKPLATGFVVYSIGRDSTDNGGRAKNDEGRQFQKGTDITFTVMR